MDDAVVELVAGVLLLVDSVFAGAGVESVFDESPDVEVELVDFDEFEDRLSVR
ncbi:hypothetical protein [Microtetraspora glauca]|uniref:hypothetical protein n=1 Tax=Microtetraspora glauca TaxID=1996 RepID=UPI003F4D1588